MLNLIKKLWNLFWNIIFKIFRYTWYLVLAIFTGILGGSVLALVIFIICYYSGILSLPIFKVENLTIYVWLGIIGLTTCLMFYMQIDERRRWEKLPPEEKEKRERQKHFAEELDSWARYRYSGK